MGNPLLEKRFVCWTAHYASNTPGCQVTAPAAFIYLYFTSRQPYPQPVPFTRIEYHSLNDRQKENYNFQKISGLLADYGFSTVRLTADWQGADFLAQHRDGVTFLRVQLKGRLALDKKYRKKDLWICFPTPDGAYLFPHDDVLTLLLNEGRFEGTRSWDRKGTYHFPYLTPELKQILAPYFLSISSSVLPEPATAP